jgi:hypothetical protein
MDSNGVFTISTREHLAALRSRARGRPKFRRIALALPGLSDAERAAQERRLNRSYFACGCGESSAVALAALAAMLLWITLRDGGWAGASWWDALATAAAFIAASGLGKGLGRLRARRDLAAGLAELDARLAPPTAAVAEGHPARCGVGRGAGLRRLWQPRGGRT